MIVNNSSKALGYCPPVCFSYSPVTTSALICYESRCTWHYVLTSLIYVQKVVRLIYSTDVCYNNIICPNSTLDWFFCEELCDSFLTSIKAWKFSSNCSLRSDTIGLLTFIFLVWVFFLRKGSPGRPQRSWHSFSIIFYRNISSHWLTVINQQ